MDIIKKFRGWCHKVLPLVYDDSLSYYEFLCKVLKKLNEVIDAVNKLIEGGGYDPTVIGQIQEDITRLKNTVKTISEDLETLSDTVDTLEDTVGGLVDAVSAIEDALDTKVGNASEKTVGQFSIAKNSANKIVLSLTYDNLPSGAVIDRIECGVGISGGTIFRAFPLYPNVTNTDFFACSQGGDNGNTQFSFNSGSNEGLTITTLTQESNTLWTTNISENDTPLWAKIYYHT